MKDKLDRDFALVGSNLKPLMPCVKSSEAPPTPVEKRNKPLHMISAAEIPKASG